MVTIFDEEVVSITDTLLSIDCDESALLMMKAAYGVSDMKELRKIMYPEEGRYERLKKFKKGKKCLKKQ